MKRRGKETLYNNPHNPGLYFSSCDIFKYVKDTVGYYPFTYTYYSLSLLEFFLEKYLGDLDEPDAFDDDI